MIPSLRYNYASDVTTTQPKNHCCIACTYPAQHTQRLDSLPEAYRMDVFAEFPESAAICEDCFSEHNSYANMCDICEDVDCLGCTQIEVDYWVPNYAPYDPED